MSLVIEAIVGPDEVTTVATVPVRAVREPPLLSIVEAHFVESAIMGIANLDGLIFLAGSAARR